MASFFIRKCVPSNTKRSHEWSIKVRGLRTRTFYTAEKDIVIGFVIGLIGSYQQMQTSILLALWYFYARSDCPIESTRGSIPDVPSQVSGSSVLTIPLSSEPGYSKAYMNNPNIDR